MASEVSSSPLAPPTMTISSSQKARCDVAATRSRTTSCCSPLPTLSSPSTGERIARGHRTGAHAWDRHALSPLPHARQSDREGPRPGHRRGGRGRRLSDGRAPASSSRSGSASSSPTSRPIAGSPPRSRTATLTTGTRSCAWAATRSAWLAADPERVPEVTVLREYDSCQSRAARHPTVDKEVIQWVPSGRSRPVARGPRHRRRPCPSSMERRGGAPRDATGS